MWKSIRSVLSGTFKILDSILPTIYLLIMTFMIVVSKWNIGGIMFFIWCLVMYSTDRIVDAIKELKLKKC